MARAKATETAVFEFPEVRVVEASAGSGKTYTLAKRYVQLLLSPSIKDQQPLIRSILAITFTNKAAMEMKGRILSFLKKIALGDLPAGELDDILAPIGISPEEAGRKSFVIMEQIIRQFNFFQVQTIDSFIKTLLLGCAFKTGLTAGFRIRTNSQEYLEHALDELIDNAGSDKSLRGIFQEFLHNYLYLENRSGWFPKEDMLAILKALFTQFNHYGLDYRDSPVGSAELIKLRHTVLKNIKNLHSELDGDNIDKRFINSLDNFVKTHDTSFDIDTLSSYFEREDLPVKKGGKAPDRLHKAWDKIRKDLKRICEDEAFSLFNPYVHIFQQALAAFETIATKEDVLFLEELNRKASQLFKQGDISVGELYYRLATRFRHYLLDEFQDTSRLQWKNIEPMASEALASGGSLFYVGDKKQAIYDFRGGDVELFDEIRTGLKDYNVQLETLTKNWRSQKEVVEFNNAVFSAENLRGFISRKEAFEAEKKKKGQVVFSEEDLTVVEQAFGNSLQTCKNENTGGYVKVEHLDVDKKDERDEALRERIVPLIKDLSRRFTLSDIAILTRNNKEVERVTGWLLAENIFVESERTSNVRENPVIQEIVSLLKFLNSPIDNLSFAQFLLGESFRKANGDMFPSPKGTGTCPQNMHDFLFSIRPRIKGEKDFYIYMAFREQYPEQWQGLFEEFFKNVGLYPMYEMTVSIYNRFQLLKNFPEYQGFLMRFLELIKREEEDHSDIASFLEYFDELEGDDLFVHVTDTEAVKVLTVHKSKGLEFPVVILPFLGMNVQVGEGAGDNQQSYVLQKEADSVRLLRLKSKYYNYSDELYAIYAREYKKNFLSELNNIYVALTRPQYELYVFLSNKVGQHHNPARFLFPHPESSNQSLPPRGEGQGGGIKASQTTPPPAPPTRGGEFSSEGSLNSSLGGESHANSFPPPGGEGEGGGIKSSQTTPPLGGEGQGGGLILYEFGDKLKYPPKKETPEDNILRLPSSDHHDWIDYLKDEFAPFDNLKNRKQKLRGSVIHFMLSFVGNLASPSTPPPRGEGQGGGIKASPSIPPMESHASSSLPPVGRDREGGSIQRFLDQALKEAALFYPGLDNLKDHLAIVEKLVTAPQLASFMRVEDGEVQTEVDVVNALGHTKRLDRLIIKEKEVWVVDYKPSPDVEGKYQEQVRGYMNILKELHPKVGVKGFLVYMEKVGVEEVGEKAIF